ncbi:unnamed protein product [Cochlearia groenlandica]
MTPPWKWENATAGAVAGFATVASMHPLDVVRTRFQVNDGRGGTSLHTYKNTAHAVFTIARLEGLRGLYAGFFPAVIGSTVSWGLYFFFYGRAKQRYGRDRDNDKLSPGLHLASAAEAGGLVCLCTNPIWLVKTRLQLQTPLHQTKPYSGLLGLLHKVHKVFIFVNSGLFCKCVVYFGEPLDAFRTIVKEEGPKALYKGIVPSLVLVSHGAIQFTAYEELRKIFVGLKAKRRKDDENLVQRSADSLLNSADYAALGGSSKVAAVLLTYPFQVIRARLQQRPPSTNGTPRYIDSLHVIRETARFEGFRGFYRGLTANLLKNVPASSITFIVYENVLKLLKQPSIKDQ